MANRRDLHVAIDADDRGFGAAFEDAQEKAKGLDRELAKLERQQAAQEKVTTRTAAAIDRFAKSEDKAALAARKMGLEVKRAAEQAEKAEVRAAAAAEAASKGLLDEEKAAKLAARADDAIERAAIKAAEAQLAQAAAAEKVAAEERKAAESAAKLAAEERKAAAAADKHRASTEGMRGGLASAAVAAAALAVPVGAAGLAFVGFAAVAAPSIKKVIAAQTDLGANWDTLDRGQKVAASSVASLVNEYKALAKSYEPDALATFNGLVSTARGLLPTLGKTVDSTKAGFMDFSTTVESSLNRQIPRLAGILQGQATPALHELGTTFDQTASTAVNLVQGLAPMGMTLLHSANGVLTLANALTSIDPHLTEFAATAIALRGPTTALSGLWEKGSTKLGLFGKGAEEAETKVGGLAKGAAKTEGVMTRLGKSIGSSPNLYIGAALAAVYLASRLSAAGDSTDHLVASLRTENNAFGNNAAGHRAVAAALTPYINQERAAAKAAETSAVDMRDRQHITTVYTGQIKELTEARKKELKTAADITAGEKLLGQQYHVSADQAGQLATAAGVDLSKSMTSSGQLTQSAAAKMQQYEANVALASDPTRRVALDMTQLGNSGLLMADRLKAADDALSAYFGPASDAWNATTQLKAGMDQLAEAAKKAKGNFSGNTAASQALRQAFDQQLGVIDQLRNANIENGKSVDYANKHAQDQLQVMYALAGNSKSARDQVDKLAASLGVTAGKSDLSKTAFMHEAAAMALSKTQAEALWKAYQKLAAPVKLTADDADFLSKLHNAQGLHIDPKTGLLLGNNSDYFNKWLKAKGLKIDPKTGLFRGNNSDYYNKWLAANHLHIDTKTGKIVGNTTAFWNAVNAIPPTVGTRKIGVYYVPLNSANEPGHTRSGSAHGGPIHRAHGGPVARMADGGPSGPVVGPGSGTSDDIPVWLSNGEYVIRASQAKKHQDLLDAINGGTSGFAAGGLVARYATGGTVDPVSLSSILSDWSTAVQPASASDVSTAKKAVSTQKDQLASANAALRRAERESAKTHRERLKRADDIAAAERRVKKERSDLADATKKLSDVEKRYQAGRQSPATQLSSALAYGIANTGAFISNLETLTDRGFGVLAQHLLAQGDASAEKIAADAVKMSSSKLGGLQKQVQQADQQQTTLANLGSILTVKTAMQGGSNTWDTLLTATGLAPNDLAATLKLMAGDLSKTTAGQALLAMMKAHGFARGGEVAGGPAGVDTVPIWATNGETVMTREATARNRQVLAAMNAGARVRIPTAAIRGGDGASAGRPIEIHVHARDGQSPLAIAKATSHELGWEMKKGGG